MPRARPRPTITARLRRIEQLAQDLSREIERDGAVPSETTLRMADCIKADIEEVCRFLSLVRR